MSIEEIRKNHELAERMFHERDEAYYIRPSRPQYQLDRAELLRVIDAVEKLSSRDECEWHGYTEYVRADDLRAILRVEDDDE